MMFAVTFPCKADVIDPSAHFKTGEVHGRFVLSGVSDLHSKIDYTTSTKVW